MTIKITPEAVKERIAALESAGEISLKEQFYLEALRLLVAASDGEQLAIENFRSAMEGIGHIRRTLEETFGGLHGTHVEPDVLAECKAICDAIYAAYGRAQPPLVPSDVLNHLEHEANHVTAWHHMDEHSCKVNRRDLLTLINAIRDAQPAPVVPENCVTAEHRRVIEMLLSVCGAAFELADDSCQQDVDGEDCHVVPDDAFQKLSDALDEIENTLPTEDIDRPSVFLAWSAMPRAALKSLLQAQPAPVVPDGIELVANTLEHIGNFADAAIIRQLVSGKRAPVCTCPSGDGSLRWPCPVHPGNSPVIPDNSVIGWLRYDYQESIKKVGGPLFILGANDPSDAWGVKYMPVAKAGEQQSAPQNIPEIIPDSCTWTFSNYDDHWSGTCGVEWIFPDGGPEENGVKFCPKCGKSVAVSATEGTEE